MQSCHSIIQNFQTTRCAQSEATSTSRLSPTAVHLEFLFGSCRKIGQNIVALDDPAGTSKDNTPDQHVPENIKSNRDIGSSFLCQQQPVGDHTHGRPTDNGPNRKVSSRKGHLDVGIELLHEWTVATVERHGDFGHHVGILEWVGEFTQQHANHGRHVAGANDAATAHISGSDHVVAHEQIVVRSKVKGLGFRVPSQPQNVDDRIVDHISRAKL